MDSVKYAFTMKLNSGHLDATPDKGQTYRRKVYNAWKALKSQKLDIHEWNEEFDSCGRLHIHAIYSAPDHWTMGQCIIYTKMQGYSSLHTKTEKIYDEKGWKEYITKDQTIEDNFVVDRQWKDKEIAAILPLLRPIPLSVTEFY